MTIEPNPEPFFDDDVMYFDTHFDSGTIFTSDLAPIGQIYGEQYEKKKNVHFSCQISNHATNCQIGVQNTSPGFTIFEDRYDGDRPRNTRQIDSIPLVDLDNMDPQRPTLGRISYNPGEGRIGRFFRRPGSFDIYSPTGTHVAVVDRNKWSNPVTSPTGTPYATVERVKPKTLKIDSINLKHIPLDHPYWRNPKVLKNLQKRPNKLLPRPVRVTIHTPLPTEHHNLIHLTCFALHTIAHLAPIANAMYGED